MTQLASLTRQQQSRVPDGARSSWQTTQSQNARAFTEADAMETPPAPPTNSAASETNQTAARASGGYSQVSRPVSDGWYARRRDQAQAVLGGSAASSPAESSPPQPTAAPQPREDIPPPPTRHTAVEAQPLTPLPYEKPAAALSSSVGGNSADSRVLLEWTRPAAQPFRSGNDLTGVALLDTNTTRR
jgi:hypothetical protein